MFGSDKKGSRGHVAAISTLIANGTSLRGDATFAGGLHLDGAIEGSITGEGTDAVLTISEHGRVHGEVRVANAIINGQVIGDVHVAQRLELAAQARIEGNVYYKVLEMVAGAQVNGKMVFESDVPRQLAPPSEERDG